MSETNFVRLSKTLTLGAMAGVGVKLTGADVEALVRTITGMGEEIETLNARIAELEAERRWIPVSERLPEDGREVLVFAEELITAGSHYQIGAASNDDDVLVETPTWLLGLEGEVYGCDAYDAVTHWMSLPTPPEVK